MIKRIIHFVARLYIKLRYGIRNDYAATSLAVDFYHDYQKRKESPLKIFMIHQRGFTVENWHSLNITRENYKTCLSDAQYIRMQQMNSKFSFMSMAKLYIKLRYGIRNDYAATSLAGGYLHDYKQKRKPIFEIFVIHQRGFTVSDWMFLELTRDNYKVYLSNARYYAMHPLNGNNSYIIDDKLNLKKYCQGTELDRYMPRYYYNINAEGKIEKLMDCPDEAGEPTAESIIRLLKETGALAIKQTSGSLGIGFYKGEYKDGNYWLNGEKIGEEELCTRFTELKNYLITEYLYPHKELAEYCPNTCNCIRYLIGRVNGKMELLKGYVRFGTKQSGSVENYNTGGILCYLNERGEFSEGNIIDYSNGLNQIIAEHCDNGVKLTGNIPLWSEVEQMKEAFDTLMPQMNYLGIDVVITSNNVVKVLEINSLTSLDGLQLNGSILETEAGKFFRQYM